MSDVHTVQQPMHSSSFAQMLAEKRAQAGLSLPQLAAMSRLPLDLLEGLELRGQAVPGFEICAKIAQALNSRHTQGLMVARDLWQAALTDKAATPGRVATTGSLRSEASPHIESGSVK